MVMPGASEASMEQYVLEKFAKFRQRGDAFTKAAPWTSDYGKRFGNMHNFLRACAAKSPLLASANEKAAGDAMTEGTGASGGHLVPTEFSYDIIRLMTAATVVRQICRIFPMSTWKRTLPRQLTNPSVTWVSEFGAKGITKPSFEQLTQQAKVMAAVIKASDELLRDTAVNLQQFLAEIIAEAFGLEEERVALAGKGTVGGGSDPFDGVLYEAGVVSVSQAAADLDYDDIIDLRFGLSAANDRNGVFVLNRTALKLIMKLKSAEGEYLWSAPRDGNPGLIGEKAYHLTDQLPTNLGAGTATPILYGNFSQYLWLSDREGIALKVSNEASDWVSGALDSAFMSDQTWMRFIKAMAITVAQGAAFAKMLVK
jgi:HK97 family phage major capsid protein